MAAQTFTAVPVAAPMIAEIRAHLRAYAKKTGNADGFRVRKLGGSQRGRVMIGSFGTTAEQRIEVCEYLQSVGLDIGPAKTGVHSLENEIRLSREHGHARTYVVVGIWEKC